MAKELSDELQCPTSARLPVLKLLNYKKACKQAGTLFELTPTKLHLQVVNQITGAKRPVASKVLWVDCPRSGPGSGLDRPHRSECPGQ